MIYKCNSCGKRYTKGFESCPSCGGIMFIDETPIKSDKSSVGLNILSFFIFWVGIILYFVYRKSSPKKAKGCLISALIIPVMAAMGSLVYNITGNTTPGTDDRIMNSNYTVVENNDVDTQETEEIIVYEKCSISEMYDELDDNALRAERKYNYKNIEITGRLDYIDSDGMTITLRSPDNNTIFESMDCILTNEAQREKIMEVSTGDIITLNGKIISVGELLGYTLKVDNVIG